VNWKAVVLHEQRDVAPSMRSGCCGVLFNYHRVGGGPGRLCAGGLGCANITPVIFSLAGQEKDMPENLAVPATLGNRGVLGGTSTDRLPRPFHQPDDRIHDGVDMLGSGLKRARW
jgi:hypothetical protein